MIAAIVATILAEGTTEEPERIQIQHTTQLNLIFLASLQRMQHKNLKLFGPKRQPDPASQEALTSGGTSTALSYAIHSPVY